MTSLRHIALGCCVLSALAGMLRLFWPENSFKSVINAALVLYILTVGVQLVHGLDWDGLVRELRSLPDGQDTADYSDYSRELALTASVDAVARGFAERRNRRCGQLAEWRMCHHTRGPARQARH